MNRLDKTHIVILLIGVLLAATALVGNGSAGIQAAPPSSWTTDTASGLGVLSINVSSFVTAAQCALCHGSKLDDFNNPGLIFKHDPHLARGIRCAACHTEFPHSPQYPKKVKRPAMTVCYNCHGISHSNQGAVASGECTLCHPAGFTRLPADHTPEFREKEHKQPASIESFSCQACHGSAFCVKCHIDKKVKPKDHGVNTAGVIKWRTVHGFERDRGGCEICHDSAYCTKCHKTQMPHPALWMGQHEKAAENMRTDCDVCHKDTKECSDCHHQFEGTTLLTQDTCKSCHSEYTKPLSELTWGTKAGRRSKGLIVHKAHFEMTKTDPYECDECHDRDWVSAKGCFSFELCYECHGRMRGGSLVAKWGGQELCYRCHQRK